MEEEEEEEEEEEQEQEEGSCGVEGTSRWQRAASAAAEGSRQPLWRAAASWAASGRSGTLGSLAVGGGIGARAHAGMHAHARGPLDLSPWPAWGLNRHRPSHPVTAHSKYVQLPKSNPCTLQPPSRSLLIALGR